ncbi:DinB family protein [Isosphaeraceae bacterium EP7]
MNGTTALKTNLEETKSLLEKYLADFSDADIQVRPVPNANHVAWQIGNVIAGEHFMLQAGLPDAKFPELPPGFADRHSSKAAGVEGPEGLLTKDEYLALFNGVRGAAIAALDTLTDADLDRPTEGPMAAFAPTLGHVFLATANHTMMHAGQFSVIRRVLGKPVLF